MTPLLGSLEGLRVVAVEQAVAAPLCSRHLAELGADVVKVERLDGDFARGYDTMVSGQATHFVWLNAGKRSVALDLKAPQGREALARLLERADVLVSNLGPGSIERLVDLGALEAANPGLVRCAITGYGAEGPYAGRKSYDLLVQGEAGVTMSTGTTGSPAKCGVSLADLAGGLYAFSAVLAALVERERTGRGASLDISLLDCLAEWMMPLLLAQRYGGRTPPPAGTRHATITPYGPFQAADGAVVNIAVQNDGQWRALCAEVLDSPGLAEVPAYRTNEGRLAERDAVEASVAAAVGRLDSATLRDRLDAASVPWGDLNDVAQVVTHPQLTERGRWRPVRLPGGGQAEILAAPFAPSAKGAPAGGVRRVPGLGEDSAGVLGEVGYSAGELDALARLGVIPGRP
ncbi:MAG: CaiB/BaiF CoA transferase family protein [Acidimicrobiales bacterium]